jgi:hypothetical protein
MPSPLITPTVGLTTGGDAYIISNLSVTNEAFKDTFPGSSLDSGKWVDASTGDGSVTVNDAALLAVAATGGLAAISTQDTYDNFDVSVTFTYNNTIENFSPITRIDFLQLIADTGTQQFMVAHIWDPIYGSAITVSVTVGSSTTILLTRTAKSPSRILRLVRYGGRILAYAGAVLLVDYSGWTDDPVNMQVSVQSEDAIALDIVTTVTNYNPKLLVTFGTEIGPSIDEGNNRVSGLIPSTKLPSVVEVQVHAVDESVSLGPDSFEYTPPLQLTVSNNTTQLVINDDDTLRDTSSSLPGLRL